MKKLPLVLIGCGAQAKYALDIFSLKGHNAFCILDPIGGKIGQKLGGHVIESLENFKNLMDNDGDAFNYDVLICLSDNHLKADLFEKVSRTNTLKSAIHPDCSIAKTAILGKGLIINARAAIQPLSSIGDGCMIHAGVVVEHDNVIENFVNLAPGVTLAGGVSVGEGTTIFSGSTIAPNVKIGKHSVVGAGSLVLDDIPDHVLAYGSPAKIKKDLNP